MRPRRISDGRSFEPEVLKVVQAAFDAAWSRVGDRFLDDEREAARDQLAEAVMNVAREKSDDVGMIRDAALRALALLYSRRLDGDGGSQSSRDSLAAKKCRDGMPASDGHAPP